MSISLPPLARRAVLVLFCGIIGMASVPSRAAVDQPAFKHQIVIDEAAKLASEPQTPPPLVSPGLLELDYDTHRKIRFRKDQAIWARSGTRFEVELFAPGSYFTSGVDIYVVESGKARHIDITEGMFDTPNKQVADLLANTGKLAGYRLHFPLNNGQYKDEFIVFLGASYFRGISKGQLYGLSARGLALDVAEPTGEEFPVFRKFWIERPAADSNSLVVHALLDSKQVAGAYRFSIYPGEPSYVDVQATLFPRNRLNHVGIAPLTSMYMFGAIDRADFEDYRPAVHDSEGLAMLAGSGEWIWRPLSNPRTLQVSAFSDTNPQGFGLIQRERRLVAYQDLEAHYHQRPSAWIVPLGDWGAGHVTLVEIPSDRESNDNIVAYWRPREALAANQPFSLEYRLSWPDDTRKLAGLSRVIRSSRGLDFRKERHLVVVDYDATANVQAQEIELEASISHGKLIDRVVQDNPDTGGWRVFLTFEPGGEPMSEIRIVPRKGNRQVGETWLFRWLAE